MDEIRIISIGILVLVVCCCVLLLTKYREITTYRKLKSITSLDIILDEENDNLKFENEEERKIIAYYINETYKGLDDLYNNNSWENKRVLYSIISSISELKDDIEFNRMSEKDLEMINSIICIYRTSKNKGRNLENIIFEWQLKYKVT